MYPLCMSEDQVLVKAVLLQQAGAFERLVASYQNLVWHIVYRMARDEATTEDLCQEVFLRVHLKLKTFRFECSLATWIGRIAFRIATRYLKKLKNEPAEPQHDPNPLLENLSGKVALEDALVRSDLAQHIQELLNTLPRLQQTLMVLYYGHDFSLQEISTMCRQPLGTVKSYLSRARNQVREKLLAQMKETP